MEIDWVNLYTKFIILNSLLIMFLVSLYVAEHVVWVVLVVPHLERLETEYLSLIKLFPLFADICHAFIGVIV